ncbi:hypothetical protein [Salipiger bermudensis]|uniref:hypothetical protein n=1 Tax=Salipiger TaxID=263377 RepID=UPI0035156F21
MLKDGHSRLAGNDQAQGACRQAQPHLPQGIFRGCTGRETARQPLCGTCPLRHGARGYRVFGCCDSL